jgi:hypothetical protein
MRLLAGRGMKLELLGFEDYIYSTGWDLDRQRHEENELI